jgi:hypothetical protein
MMLSCVQRIAAPVFLRYVLASVGALAVDMGTFLAGLALGVPAVAASVLGYALGIAAHWVLSSTVVFADDVAAAGTARRRQQALFVASALVGLGVTALVVGVLARLGLDPRAAKLAAVGISFVVTWLLRQRVVFR